MRKTEKIATEMVRNGAGDQRPSREDVAARAYEIFLARGGESGREMDDWLQAEKELMEEDCDSARLPRTGVP